MSVGTVQQLEGLRRAGRVVADVLRAMAGRIQPGITTGELDRIGDALLAERGAVSAPRSTYGFPGATCISVNDEVAHGIPGERVLEEGDLVNLDVSAEVDGFVADTGASFPVGRVAPESMALLAAGRRALEAGVGAVRTGRWFSALGLAIESTARRDGFQVIRDLTGHGVGRRLHEEPENVRHYYEPSDARQMTEGLVFTIEPMVSRTARRTIPAPDGWTLRTEDGSRVVQNEHTVVVTRRGAVVMTLPTRES